MKITADKRGVVMSSRSLCLFYEALFFLVVQGFFFAPALIQPIVLIQST